MGQTSVSTGPLPPGRYHVEAWSALGSGSEAMARANVEIGLNDLRLELVLVRGAAVSGVVSTEPASDQAFRPIPGVRVLLHDRSDEEIPPDKQHQHGRVRRSQAARRRSTSRASSARGNPECLEAATDGTAAPNGLGISPSLCILVFLRILGYLQHGWRPLLSSNWVFSR